MLTKLSQESMESLCSSSAEIANRGRLTINTGNDADCGTAHIQRVNAAWPRSDAVLWRDPSHRWQLWT